MTPTCRGPARRHDDGPALENTMKLASFNWQGRDRIGFEVNDARLVDLGDVAAKLGRWAPMDMLGLIQGGDSSRTLLADGQKFAAENPSKLTMIPVREIQWHPPVRNPSKICAIALNNSASDARKISAPDHPLFFLKPASCLIGNNEAIEVYDYYGSVHPEPELAVIIGVKCRHVAEEDAMAVVYGYSIMNDMTGNGMRAQDMVHYYALYPAKDDPTQVERREQHLSYTARYKGSDTFGPFGPWLVTKDEIADPHKLDVKCWHKDELIAEDSTAYYSYSVPRTIAFITKFHSLWPGDVISMGTAFRPGKTARRSLHTADVTALGGPVRVTISGLGTLENPVRRIIGGKVVAD
jgi:2,4-diketo-3-deoxy-L-fuconate hydrolase